MFIRLLILFICLPILEVYTLLEFGNLIGIGGTLALIILTGACGAYLARTQGFELLARIQAEMSAGRIPANELVDGLLILAGGLVLLTPGFWTDMTGFFLLVPTSRRWIRPLIQNWFRKNVKVMTADPDRNQRR